MKNSFGSCRYAVILRLNNVLTTSLFIFLLIGTFNAFAQDSKDGKGQGSFGVNTNPAYFVLGGYSIRTIYHYPQKWSFGLNAEGGFTLPDDFRDLFFNDNQRIDVDWDYAVAIEVRYRFTNETYDKGFYAFGTLGFEGWTVEEISSEEEQNFDNWFSSVGIGYNWYPFQKKHFNLGVNYNIIFILNNAADQVVGNTSFNIEQVVPPSIVPSSITLGWRF